MQAQVEQFLHRDGSAPIGHGEDDAMNFLLVDSFHQVRRHGLAGYRAFHLARPTAISTPISGCLRNRFLPASVLVVHAKGFRVFQF